MHHTEKVNQQLINSLTNLVSNEDFINQLENGIEEESSAEAASDNGDDLENEDGGLD
jgi:hypothetical protein